MSAFQVVMENGSPVFRGTDGGGLTEAQANASVKDRNERAEAMGLVARYKTATYTPPKPKSNAK